MISATPLGLLAEEGEEPGPESDIRVLEVQADQHGERLDKALASGVSEFSRSYLQQLLETGLVTLNGKLCTKVSQKVKAGDRISLELRPTPQSQAFKPEAVAFGIAFEDAHLLVVNKPAGLVVHPAPGNWSGTLLNGLLAHDPCFLLVPRAGIVHRLDKDTSGLMVVAKTREVMDALVKAIAAREVSRQYLALAHGAWVGSRSRTVDAPIGRDPRNRLRMAVVDLASQSGKTARTDFELQASDASSCFVRCILHTGRTHQIRVHMASIGHPLVGDSVYGGTAQFGLSRQALHATRLAFVHPVTGKQLQFDAPLAPDIQQAIAHLGPAVQSAKA
ncbi:RluA family pseudouridine synthase [Rhodoferax lacus]|uniref:Pseudouridine synthase n=1 Tax=Rhodoferax lacus TaxID=2184758 RepID=A0A3E1RJ03_9BURK|nr:RluA family pseudouridine synthase [Rhodoferax lacus]